MYSTGLGKKSRSQQHFLLCRLRPSVNPSLPLFSLSFFQFQSPLVSFSILLFGWHRDERSCRQMWLRMSSCCFDTQLPPLSPSPWQHWLLSPQQMFLENKGHDGDSSYFFSPTATLQHPPSLDVSTHLFALPFDHIFFSPALFFKAEKDDLSRGEPHICGILLKPCSNKTWRAR